MSTTLDKQELFDEQGLQIESESVHRDAVERKVSGLDGVLSIDLGERSRKIKQTGTLQARSRSQMDSRINSISSYMDGKTHTLVMNSGEEFNNLRMDIFKVSKRWAGGAGVTIGYEIVYTQLKV